MASEPIPSAPVALACGNPEHVVTRVLCECPWFDGRCHECPNTDVPMCMEEYRYE